MLQGLTIPGIGFTTLTFAFGLISAAQASPANATSLDASAGDSTPRALVTAFAQSPPLPVRFPAFGSEATTPSSSRLGPAHSPIPPLPPRLAGPAKPKSSNRLPIGTYDGYEVLLASAEAQDRALDLDENYAYVLSIGYYLIALAEAYDATGDPIFIDYGVKKGAHLLDHAWRTHQYGHSSPGWGLDYAWDAFQDGTINPAYTEYAFQDGAAINGLVRIAQVILDHPDLFAPYRNDANYFLDIAREVIDKWHGFYTDLGNHGSPGKGFYWYSVEPNDAELCVWNNSASLCMAELVIADITGNNEYLVRPREFAAYLASGLHYDSASDSHYWYYNSWGIWSPTVEDISHALWDTWFLSEAAHRGWISSTTVARLSNTYTKVVWGSNPSWLHGRTDGSDAGTTQAYTLPSTLGFTTFADAPGGDPFVWELARSIVYSSYMTHSVRDLSNPVGNTVLMNAITRLYRHAPDAATWSVTAGDPFDNDASRHRPGVSFHPQEWNDAAPLMLPLSWQTGKMTRYGGGHVNLYLNDPDPGVDCALSIIYLAVDGAGTLSQWDGTRYHALNTYPETELLAGGASVFFRTTVRARRDLYYDYDQSTPGLNVLFQLDRPLWVHRVEGTELR